jgi:Aminoglycoside-2''-adenylyltransferase
MDSDLQLRAIGHIVRAVDAGLWLRGGWAMDFFLGEVTRPHRDIDFFCRDTDADRTVTRLAAFGYRVLPGNPALQRDLLGPHDLEVQITLLGRDADGCPTVPAGPYAGARWPADLLDAPPGRIGDVTCPIVSPRAQIEIKEMMPVWVPGLPRRAKDLQDVVRLRSALG